MSVTQAERIKNREDYLRASFRAILARGLERHDADKLIDMIKELAVMAVLSDPEKRE